MRVSLTLSSTLQPLPALLSAAVPPSVAGRVGEDSVPALAHFIETGRAAVDVGGSGGGARRLLRVAGQLLEVRVDAGTGRTHYESAYSPAALPSVAGGGPRDAPPAAGGPSSASETAAWRLGDEAGIATLLRASQGLAAAAQHHFGGRGRLRRRLRRRATSRSQ